MSAMYQLRFQGIDGLGHGSVYIGRGVLLGIDVLGGRYAGSYVDQDGFLVGKATLTVQAEMIMGGQNVPAGTVVPIGYNLPPAFADGAFHEVIVGGQAAQVAFVKIGDIP